MGHMSSLHLLNSDCGGLSKEINKVQCRWQQRTHKTHTFTPCVRRACCVIASPSVEEEEQQKKKKLVRTLLSFGTNVHLHPALVISSTSWLMAPPVMEPRITQYIQYITSAAPVLEFTSFVVFFSSLHSNLSNSESEILYLSRGKFLMSMKMTYEAACNTEQVLEILPLKHDNCNIMINW